MTRKELQTICNKAKRYPIVANSGKSDTAIMALELMDTNEYSNDYCGALREHLTAVPVLNRDGLEAELDKYN